MLIRWTTLWISWASGIKTEPSADSSRRASAVCQPLSFWEVSSMKMDGEQQNKSKRHEDTKCRILAKTFCHNKQLRLLRRPLAPRQHRFQSCVLRSRRTPHFIHVHVNILNSGCSFQIYTLSFSQGGLGCKTLTMAQSCYFTRQMV